MRTVLRTAALVRYQSDAYCFAYSCVSPTPIINEIPQQFLLKMSTTKFHEDPLSGCRAVTRDTNQQTSTQLSVTEPTAATFRLIPSHTRMDSGKKRAQKWPSKTKSADMCPKKGPITGRLDNNEHNEKWRRQCAPRQWAHRHTRASHFERSYGNMRTDGEGRVTCRTGENEMWANVTRAHRTTAQCHVQEVQ